MKTLKTTLLIFLLTLPTIKLSAQAVGDNFQSNGSGNWNSVNTWQEYYGGTWHNPANHIPSSLDGTVTILNTHTITVTANITVDQVTVNSSGSIVINNGVALTVAHNTVTDLSVYGSVINSGTITQTGGIIYFQSGSTYQHAEDGGTIPAATWDPASTCYINYTAGFLTTTLQELQGNRLEILHGMPNYLPQVWILQAWQLLMEIFWFRKQGIQVDMETH